jgi:hypothetical protein
VHPILRAGWRGELDADAMAPRLEDDQRCAGVTARAQAEWRAAAAAPEPSLSKAFARLTRRSLLPCVASARLRCAAARSPRPNEAVVS